MWRRVIETAGDSNLGSVRHEMRKVWLVLEKMSVSLNSQKGRRVPLDDRNGKGSWERRWSKKKKRLWPGVVKWQREQSWGWLLADLRGADLEWVKMRVSIKEIVEGRGHQVHLLTGVTNIIIPTVVHLQVGARCPGSFLK